MIISDHFGRICAALTKGSACKGSRATLVAGIPPKIDFFKVDFWRFLD